MRTGGIYAKFANRKYDTRETLTLKLKKDPTGGIHNCQLYRFSYFEIRRTGGVISQTSYRLGSVESRIYNII